MALLHRFPVFAWQDCQAGWTACLVDQDAPAGFGKSADLAVEQLADYLNWLYAESPWLSAPDFLDPEVMTFKVPVRPEYKHESRRFPCDETFLLRVHGVRGRQEHGMLVCSLPVLGLRFYYYEEQALRNLVTHYVQQHLEGHTPAALGRVLPPAQVQLASVPIAVRSRRGKEPALADRVPALAGVAEPLGGSMRRQFSRPYERDRQVADLVQRLGKEKASVLLVGEPGSGKTTVLVEAVRQLERGGPTQPGGLARLYWQTSAGRLIAGMKYLGQWEERCEEVIEEIASYEGVLCVENLLDLVRQGGTSPTNSLGAFFLPYLQRGELRMVGEVTPAELDACRRLLPGLADVFQLLVLPAFTRSEAIGVLDHVANLQKGNLHIEVGRGVVAGVYHLFRRFWPEGAFPARAAGFLQSVFDVARQRRLAEVTTDLVLEAFIRQTGLPELFLRDDLALDRESVVATFRRQVMGQEEACRAAAALVVTFKGGMNDPGRPAGVMLFCGPTGVGKTEMARAIAAFFFGQGAAGDRLIRLDMSEYSGWRAGERLLANPDGEPSELILKVRQQPFVVVLLDEIEKADPEVFDVLLGVLDEGRLSDRFGRVTSFRSAIVILTSNLGATNRGAFGFGDAPRVDYGESAMGFFRPEFFNRLDRVVTFDALGAETIRAITRKELDAIARREGMLRAGVGLAWSDRLEEVVAREGFDERYGARPLQRALETLVVAPLARFLLEHPDLEPGTIALDVDEQGCVLFQT